MCVIRSHIAKETLKLCRKTNVHQTRAASALFGESSSKDRQFGRSLLSAYWWPGLRNLLYLVTDVPARYL
jgi:hypothetical protein